ncbi:hypothetical protein [Paraburkholderia xenovorans]|uniref:hypothetical protein n=1 Tax=Paraburkholderia xenovorans TaxID=36873 RepID=UPI0038BDC1B6
MAKGEIEEPLRRPTAAQELRDSTQRGLRRPGSQLAALHTRKTIMRVAAKGLVLSAFVLSLSGAAYAQGAGTSGGGGAGAGQGGTGMGTPNSTGTTESPSGASGANTMGKSADMSQKQMKSKTEKKGGMDAPASEGGGMKKAY